TREQVAMAVGYPISSENPRLDVATWRYWRSMNDEFQVLWNADGLVTDVIGGVIARRAVFEE
ncbi:MAG: cell envelope protein SmpA, partial [Burkholderiales bacterium]